MYIRVHYRIIEIIDDLSGVSAKPESIEQIQTLFVQKHSIEVCAPFK
jgi:hypothetical protein